MTRTRLLTAALVTALSITAIPTASTANSNVGFSITIGKSTKHHGHRKFHKQRQHRSIIQKHHKPNFSRHAPIHQRQRPAARIRHHDSPFFIIKKFGNRHH